MADAFWPSDFEYSILAKADITNIVPYHVGPKLTEDKKMFFDVIADLNKPDGAMSNINIMPWERQLLFAMAMQVIAFSFMCLRACHSISASNSCACLSIRASRAC